MTTRVGANVLVQACRPFWRSLVPSSAMGRVEGMQNPGADLGLHSAERGVWGRHALFHTAPQSLASLPVTIPALGESISDGTVASLLKKAGDTVEEDEPIVSIETDKVTVDVRAPQAGVILAVLVRWQERAEESFSEIWGV